MATILATPDTRTSKSSEVRLNSDSHQSSSIDEPSSYSSRAMEEEPVLKSEVYGSAATDPQLQMSSSHHHHGSDAKLKLPALGSHSSLSSLERCGSPLCGKLYDREEQEQQLVKAYYRRTRRGSIQSSQSSSELVLITGKSGQGKSHLAQSLRSRVEQDGGFLIGSKFDQLHSQVRPFAVLEGAFRQLMQQLKGRPHQTYISMQSRAKQAVGSEAAFLVETFPSLRGLLQVPESTRSLVGGSSPDINEEDDNPAIKPTDAQRRIATVFCRFMRAISRDQPVVLLMDDLQWIEAGSLELLKAAVQQSTSCMEADNGSTPMSETSGLLYIGSCRGNEVSFDDPLSVMLRELEDNKDCTITEIRVGNLSQEAVCEIIADLLQIQPPSRVEPLAGLVQKQTGGNALFVLHFLRSLQENGSLFRNSDGDWQWNLGEIATRAATELDSSSGESLVLLLEAKLRHLPPESQEVLKVASCLGTEFPVSVLSKASGAPLAQVNAALSLASGLEFIVVDEEEGMAMWMHDKPIEAAQALIPDNEKASTHLRIARNIAGDYTQEGFTDNLLLIVNHGINGSEAIEEEDCRLKLAELCLEAGKRVAKTSAFSTACYYLETGISLLGYHLWKDKYELSLHLHNAAAEMGYCSGDHEKAERIVNAITQNARRYEDAVQAYNTHLLCLTAAEKHKEALALGSKVTAQLGERFPLKVGAVGLLRDFLKTKRALRRMTDDEIACLPTMTDCRAQGLMSILHIMYASLLISNPMASPLCGFRMVRLTLRHGLSPLSCVGFGIHASVMSRLGMVEPAVRYGQVALRLMEKFPSGGLATKTLCTVWGDALPLKVSFRNCVEPILDSFHLGIESGATASALIAGFVHCTLALCIGSPLSSLERSTVQYRTMCHDYGQLFMVDIYTVMLQGCLNLQGKAASNPLTLTGSVMVEDDMIQKCANNQMCLLFFYQMKYLVAVYMSEFEYADSCLTAPLRKNMRSVLLPFFLSYQIFLEGLVAAAVAKKSRKKMKILRKRLKELKKAAKDNPDSLLNKVRLLEAELARLSGDIGGAVAKYEESMKLAHNEGFIHEHGLVCERAGRMLLSSTKQRTEEARGYLNTARNLYVQWGASKEKLDQLDQLLETKATSASITTIPQAEKKLATMIGVEEGGSSGSSSSSNNSPSMIIGAGDSRRVLPCE